MEGRARKFLEERGTEVPIHTATLFYCGSDIVALTALLASVAEEERERCAKKVESVELDFTGCPHGMRAAVRDFVAATAKAIRTTGRVKGIAGEAAIRSRREGE